jgi:histidine phosphotransfer protein HptB
VNASKGDREKSIAARLNATIAQPDRREKRSGNRGAMGIGEGSRMNFKENAESIGLEEDEYLEMLQVFVEVSAADFITLRAGLGTESPQLVLAAAHSIQGGAINFAFQEIHELAKSIETNARQKTLQGSGETVRLLGEKLEELAAALRARQQSLEAGKPSG